MQLLLSWLHRESWLVVLTTLALVLYGVLQERVMTRGWGPQEELFPYSSFLVLSNRLLTVLVLIGHSVLTGQTFIPVAPLRSYCLVSGSNMVSTL
jgi:adenosine 3'-phospho 5'-phosphosulfate transporter B2